MNHTKKGLFKAKSSHKLSFGFRPEEIERNLAQDDEIFFEGIRKSAIRHLSKPHLLAKIDLFGNKSAQK
jgi:hypothetical protein